MGLFFLAAAVAFAPPSLAWSRGLALASRVSLGLDQIIVGQKAPSAAKYLDCASSAVQNTIRRCELKAKALSSATSLGYPVAKVALNIHFQGDIINMSVEYASGVGFDSLFGKAKAAFPGSPKVEYWAPDDAHLYASYIWIDSDDNAEAEISRTIKGAATGGNVKVFASSLAGNRPLSPEDAP